jgi:secreted trypsin-like serine protease
LSPTKSSKCIDFRLAAYYHNGRGYSGFICGGSLVSSKIIVTAAHCVQNKRDSEKKKAEEATFYIGKYNLESFNEPNYIQTGVTDLIVHSEWNINDNRFDADIAIAVLLRTIEFTKFVKPICLWTSTTSFVDLVGKKGIVVGWGKTEIKAVSTEKPLYNEIPVVTDSTCLRSNPAFSELTSDRTFCAGERSGKTGPCAGDSGETQNGKIVRILLQFFTF